MHAPALKDDTRSAVKHRQAQCDVIDQGHSLLLRRRGADPRRVRRRGELAVALGRMEPACRWSRCSVALSLGGQGLQFTIRGQNLSAGFVAQVLAMSLLGPAPAVAIALLAAMLHLGAQAPVARALAGQPVELRGVPVGRRPDRSSARRQRARPAQRRDADDHVRAGRVRRVPRDQRAELRGDRARQPHHRRPLACCSRCRNCSCRCFPARSPRAR